MTPASHNTFTYLPVQQWWLQPFTALFRCQDHDIVEQYRYGARLFDLRVTFRHGIPVIAHGVARFRGDIFALLDDLDASAFFDATTTVYVRLTLERGNYDQRFRLLCERLASRYPHIIFYGGHAKQGWRKVYNFEGEPSVVEAYASYHGGKPHPIQGIFPRQWAKANNPCSRCRHQDNDVYLMQDFLTTY